MKRSSLIIAAFFVLFCGVTSKLEAQYCSSPMYCSGFNLAITSFTLNKYKHTSTCSINAYDTSQVGKAADTLKLSGSNTIKITSQGAALRFGVWVDWNNDGDFNDAGELIDTTGKTASSSFSTTKLVVPSKTRSGLYRLRIRGFASAYIGKNGACQVVKGFQSGGETEDYGFYVKNITYNDAGVSRVLSPSNNSCGDSNTPITVVVNNFGSNSVTKIPVTIKITPKSGTGTTYTDTIYKTLGAGGADTLTLAKKINTFFGGQYTVTAYTSYATDTTNYNDTITYLAAVSGGVQDPLDSNVTLCSSASVKLFTQDIGYSVFWYNSPTSNVRLTTGDTFITPYLTSPATYYVAYSTAYVYNIGQPNNSIGKGSQYNNNFDNGEVFTAKSTFTLDSVTVYAGSAGKVVVNLENSSATVLKSVTVTVGSAGKYQIPVGFTVLGGSNYILTAKSSTVSSLYRNTDGTTYPISGGSVLDITGNTAGTGYAAYYYFFYNWVVTGPGCFSKRIPINVSIGKPYATLSAGKPFMGAFGPGNAANPDTVSSGDSIRYTINPPFAMTNADYGKKWFISNLSFKTASGKSNTDTAFTYPTAKSSGTFTFHPTASFSDSLLILSYKVSSSSGCDSIITRYIYVGSRPKSSFTYTGTCSGTPTQFSNTSTIAKGSLNYFWDFGDGSTSNLPSPSHTFMAGGTYKVKLKSLASNGASDSTTITINLYDHPIAKFGFANTCFGSRTQFTDSSTIPSGKITSHYYYFGDFSSPATAANPTHKYLSSGLFFAEYVVTSDKGCPDTLNKGLYIYTAPKPAFTTDTVCEGNNTGFVNNSVDSNFLGGTLTYLWRFGDGTTSTDSMPSHIYKSGGAFDTRLIATSSFGCVDSIIGLVNVYPKPKTRFGVSGLCLQQATVFTDSSYLPVGNISRYEWNFGDSSYSLAVHPSHKYLAAGTYNVALTQYTNFGCVNSLSKTITIGSAPNAAFDYAANGRTISFIPADTNAGTYSWNFGDGQSSALKLPSHTYGSDSSYTASLTVSNGTGGCSSSTISRTLKTTTGIGDAAAVAINLSIYPNPFKDRLDISYKLDKSGFVNAIVYDMSGKHMATLCSSRQIEGSHIITLDALQYNLRPGMYLLRMSINNSAITRQLIMLR
jgi:PKD repeat protein